MAKNPFHITDTAQSQERRSAPSFRQHELQARFERLWLLDPEQFNPLRNCLQRQRLDRTLELLNNHTNCNDKKAVDLGCAAGVFSRRLRDGGATVESVDIAENALKHLRKNEMHRITAKQDAMPDTSLKDQDFDLVVCMEVIADLPPKEFRLFFSELARLVKTEGHIICSTPIDIYTEGAIHRFLDLAETELNVLEARATYHALYIRLCQVLEAPDKFVRGWKDTRYRQQEIDSRSRLSALWYRLNSSSIAVWPWFAIKPISNSILSHMKNSSWMLEKLEKVCQFFWDEAGISHFMIIAQRKPLQVPEEPVVTRLGKKEIWE